MRGNDNAFNSTRIWPEHQKRAHVWRERVSTKNGVYPVAIYQYLLAKQEATNYWYTCARSAFNDPDWFIENHHAVRQAKRKSTITKMKAYRDAWEEHRNRYQKDIEKLESENTELKRRLGEAKRDIDAYKRLVGGDSHA